jgi:hypothetical protein
LCKIEGRYGQAQISAIRRDGHRCSGIDGTTPAS